MEKQTSAVTGRSLRNPETSEENFKKEIRNCSDGQLINIKKKLDFLALNLDPYNQDNFSLEAENILDEFNLRSALLDPFLFTNTVLRYIDFTQEEVTRRKH